ncbi:glycoside hydrolase family 6 protein [Microbispora sp. NEAU-D428]|uniref:glycoside hydrolase family 6 protein n=1 Tax=Microbispora sitophila TaxID=2771537 RepID=UPI00186627D2|nr:glycoside hydrolase family 6 protein [Microbispora sitophila]MBE3008471.1 glycoside hydrolase family 6 protein [Microbispora sitophila]
MTSGAEGDGPRDGDPLRIGPFRILGRLGQGGMGTVYLGQDAEGHDAAVKVIHPQWAADPDFRRRFQREVAAAQRVARFCTAAVLGAGLDGDVAYLATEYVPGPTLQEVVRERGPLSGSSLEAVAVNVAVALQAIHSAGVIHRDLKPSNVLLSPVGPKVIDFGIAHVADATADISGIVAGTPSFMSPEQAKGDRLTPASDIFAWGALVAYTASGRAPFSGGSIPSVLYRVLHEPPHISGLDPRLRSIVDLALAKDPAQRPTAQRLIEMLTGHEPIEPAPERVRQDGTRHRAEVAAPTTTAGGTGRRWRLGAGITAAATAIVVTAGVVVAVRAASSGDPEPSPKPPAPTTSSASGGNPLRGQAVRLYASPTGDEARQADVWQAAGRAGDAALMRKLAAVPRAVWLGQTSAAEAARAASTTLEAAARQDAVPVFVTDHIPLRACNEDGGAADSADYLAWIDALASAVGDRRAVFVLEPNSLAELPGSPDCSLGDADDQRARLRMLASAVKRLGALPNTAVYLDGSLDGWPAAEVAATRLIDAGVADADGFYLNVSGYQKTDRLVAYGTRLAACVTTKSSGRGRACADAGTDAGTAGLPHFVIDTSRNGKGEWTPPAGRYKDPQDWCNPPGRGAGVRPTTRTGSALVDAYLWVRPAGMSDDRCDRGEGGPTDPVYGVVPPYGGAWWPELALQRAKDAVPPL